MKGEHMTVSPTEAKAVPQRLTKDRIAPFEQARLAREIARKAQQVSPPEPAQQVLPVTKPRPAETPAATRTRGMGPTVLQRYEIDGKTAKILKIHSLLTNKTAEEIVNAALVEYLSNHKEERSYE
jgi:hypothetical protein